MEPVRNANFLNQKLWEWGQILCGLTSPSGDSVVLKF